MPLMPIARAAPVDRSMQRPLKKGPRSLIVTVTLRPLLTEPHSRSSKGGKFGRAIRDKSVALEPDFSHGQLLATSGEGDEEPWR